ncbi:MAG: glycerol-3-phosphate acyltransferase, partial [Spirochaetia bacterium]|nr:glycerol-3-phosphate acyltransferase [Spirochaetia bacterium]
LEELATVYGIDRNRLAVVAGANYPEQVLERKIVGYEVAANDPGLVNHLAMLFSTGYSFTRPAVNQQDVRGVQLGGALKNVYALGIGLLDGYYEKNLGGNTDSSLFHVSNRIFAEMTAIGTALGGQPSTFTGLSGLTDLMLSCFGQDARDRQYGHDYAYGKADPDHKSPGLFGIRFLPGLLPIDPEKYPVAAAIHACIVQKVDLERIMNDLVYRLRRF